MFFLLRMAFWLGLVCVLLPGGGDASGGRIDTANAVSAAGAAVSDLSGFCSRQPDACVVGGQVAVAIGHKAEAGARSLYEMISTKMAESNAPAAQNKAVPGERGTLSSADMAPIYRLPGLSNVPLPPRREARAARPSA
jgi:hypothetical protein